MYMYMYNIHVQTHNGEEYNMYAECDIEIANENSTDHKSSHFKFFYDYVTIG